MKRLPATRPNAWVRLAIYAGALFAGSLGDGFVGHPAQSVEITVAGGEVRGSFDTTLSIGAAMRVSDQDEGIIGRENGGQANSVNGDNGNLNYESGDPTSLSGKVTHELELGWKNLGFFSRAFYFYDTVVMDMETARTSISNRARDEIGRDFTLLDAYGAVDFNVGDVYVTLKGGNQVLSWGESTFIQNGINTVSPVDVSKLRVAGAELRDGFTAIPMAQAFVALTDRFSVEGFYQIAWDHTEIEPEGTFFSTNDFASPGGKYVMLGFGAPGISDDPVFMDANIPVGSAVPRQRDRDPGDDGQFGAVLRWFEPALANTEFGFYYTKLHSRLPLISAITGTEIGLADGNYAETARYFREFPEDIDTYGFSFNTEVPWLNSALQGEFAFHAEQPLQVDDVELLFAALTPVSSALFGQNQLGVYDFDEEITGWRARDVWQTQLTATKLFGPRFGTDQIAIVGEYGITVVPDLEDPEVLRYEAPGTYTSGNPFFTEQRVQPETQIDGFPDDTSMGYRLVARAELISAIGVFNLTPQIAWSHDFRGTTPSPLGNFIEGRKTVTASVGVEYLVSWTGQIAYTNSFGGDEFNLLADRDFVSVTASYSF